MQILLRHHIRYRLLVKRSKERSKFLQACGVNACINAYKTNSFDLLIKSQYANTFILNLLHALSHSKIHDGLINSRCHSHWILRVNVALI